MMLQTSSLFAKVSATAGARSSVIVALSGQQRLVAQASRRNYNTVLERQTNSAIVNMDTTAMFGVLESMQLIHGLSLSQSLVLIQIGLSLAHGPLKYLVRKVIDDKNLIEKYRLTYQRYLFNDLERDAYNYRLDTKTTEKLKSHYAPSQIISLSFSTYWQYVFYKNLNLMSNYPALYPSPLHHYDPTFIAPMAIMSLNYLLLQRSQHPFLINIRNKWTSISKSLLVLYLSSLSLVLPQTYLISWAAFGMTHLLVKESGRLWERKRHEQRMKRIFN